ncbi:MAG: UDP-N-acetylglucosamine 2-epimerase (non-hydrolyzing) [Dehalococcoidia bacterium]|nr:UDP-N-acetylglucosamine 2-epimerase (non-hydrolyzing) [Dehalococcoidia bacterium]
MMAASRLRLAVVVGARPNFIKLAPIMKATRDYNACAGGGWVDTFLIHTGQHYDFQMSRIFFQELAIPEPDVHLAVGSGTHGEQTGRAMIEIEKVLSEYKPDLVMVLGDVNSTLAGALAAAKMQIAVAHVEAGLRSFDRTMPEEINRVLTDHISELLFCPTETAVGNLRNEGITKGVYLTGDVMVDALLGWREMAERSDILERLGLVTKQYVVATVHRASNTDDRRNLQNILDALSAARERVIFPVHPRTRRAMMEMAVNPPADNVSLVEPLGYLDFLKLLSHARKVVTDSGGLQKEAYILGVPCVTLRETTEWPETLESGWNTLVGSNQARILAALRDSRTAGRSSAAFGDGKSSVAIVQILTTYGLFRPHEEH